MGVPPMCCDAPRHWPELRQPARAPAIFRNPHVTICEYQKPNPIAPLAAEGFPIENATARRHSTAALLLPRATVCYSSAGPSWHGGPFPGSDHGRGNIHPQAAAGRFIAMSRDRRLPIFGGNGGPPFSLKCGGRIRLTDESNITPSFISGGVRRGSVHFPILVSVPFSSPTPTMG